MRYLAPVSIFQARIALRSDDVLCPSSSHDGIRREAGYQRLDVMRVLCREIAMKDIWQIEVS